MADFGLSPELVGWVALAALPLLLAACTAFTKISVVLGALRLGMGAEALLPYGVILALSLVLTSVVMAPTALALVDGVQAAGGVENLLGAPLSEWLAVLEPLRRFLAMHADPEELAFFAELQGVSNLHPLALVPSFLVTELGEALHMAVLILLPFVVVDLLVAQSLTLLGVSQQPPAVVALPAKLLLFLAVGGWDVVLGGLVEGYR
jgi:type III secretory pathway component EscR